MYSFTNFESVHYSNCCFLICIQVSQEAGKLAGYSQLLKNFPQFVVIHTVKGFSIVSETEIDIFLEFLCFFYDPMDVGDLISGSACSKSSLNIWKFSVHLLSQPSLKYFWYCFSLRLEWKLTFPVLWLLLSFPNCLAYWVQHFNSIIF